MSATEPIPPPVPYTRVVTAHATFDVPCEPVGDLFAITPALAWDADGTGAFNLGGGFNVTHRPTGARIPGPQACIECCRACARALVALYDVDWANLDLAHTPSFMASLRPDNREAILGAVAFLQCCDQDACAHPVPGFSPRAPEPDSIATAERYLRASGIPVTETEIRAWLDERGIPVMVGVYPLFAAVRQAVIAAGDAGYAEAGAR